MRITLAKCTLSKVPHQNRKNADNAPAGLEKVCGHSQEIFGMQEHFVPN